MYSNLQLANATLFEELPEEYRVQLKKGMIFDFFMEETREKRAERKDAKKKQRKEAENAQAEAEDQDDEDLFAEFQ